MKITWDESKRETNLAKHGLDFSDLLFEFFTEAIIAPAHSNRLKAVGMFRDGMIAVVFVTLGSQGISLVSMRLASKREGKLYGQTR